MTAIVDFEDALHLAQKALQCSICLEVMTDPILTKCGHRFCSHCMNELLKRKSPNPVLCPLCKQIVSKRSLAGQSKFENIVKVMEKLAEAFHEDLMNPTNADWCAADTLERDLSEGTLDAGCLESFLEVERSSMTSALLHGASTKMDGAEAAAVAASSADIGGARRSSRSPGREPMQELAGCGGRLVACSVASDWTADVTALDAGSGSRSTLAAHGGAEADDGKTWQQPSHRDAASTGSAANGLLADDAPRQSAATEDGVVPRDRSLVSSLVPSSPLSVSSGSDDDSPLIIADQKADGNLVRHRCDSRGHVESSVIVVGSQDGTAACAEGGSSPATIPQASAAAAAVDTLSTSSLAFDRSTGPGYGTADSPEVVAMERPVPVSHCCPAIDNGKGGTLLTDVAARQPEAGFGASAGAAELHSPAAEQQAYAAEQRMSTAEGQSSSPTALALNEDSCADIDIGDDAAFEETLITDGQPPNAVLMPLVMTGCSLNLQDVEEAQRLARVYLGRYQTTFTSAVTHVLVHAANDKAYSADALPAKVYLGVASRCHVVKVSWVYDSLQKGCLLPEDSYKLGPFLPHECCVDQAVQLPRLTSAGPIPDASGLLASWEVCCSTPCHQLSTDDLHDLMRLCRARMIRDPACFSFFPGTNRIVLVDREGAKKEAVQACARLGRLYGSPVADYKWLLVSVVYGRPFVPHRRCIDCHVPGCDDQWNRVNVPALFSQLCD